MSENRPEERIETGATTVWALADPRAVEMIGSLPAIPGAQRPMIHAEYLIRPLLALVPI